MSRESIGTPNTSDLEPSEALVWQPTPKEENSDQLDLTATPEERAQYQREVLDKKNEEEMPSGATTEEYEKYLSEEIEFRGEKMPRRQMLEIQKREKQG